MPYVSGNQARLFVGGYECLTELLRLIQSAQHHIHIEIMAFYDDKTGRMVADALKNKAQLDNVEVRVLVNVPATDGSRGLLAGNPDDPLSTDPNVVLRKAGPTLDFYDSMRASGVQVINSNPLSFYGTDIEILKNEPIEVLASLLGLPWAALVRIKQEILKRYWREEDYEPSLMPAEFLQLQAALDSHHQTTLPGHMDHRKIVVVDGTTALVATFNLGRDYLFERPMGPTLHPGFWFDAMASLTGPIVNTVQKLFAERWLLSAGDIYTTDFSPSASNSYVPPIAPTGTDRVMIASSGHHDAMTNPIRSEMELKLTEASTAGKPIVLINPYICDDGLIAALIRLAGQGSSVLIICSDHHLDSPWSRDAGQARYKQMIDAGIRICEYPGRMLHAKILLVGTDWATIGSYNWNYRSAKRDLECNAFIQSTSFATQVKQMGDSLKQASEQVVRETTWTKPWNEYPLGCLDSTNYATLPAEVKELIESLDWWRGTGTLEQLEFI
jgi:cardiolipin synthase A/B